MRAFLLFVVAAITAGCATRYEPGAGVITAGGQQICAKHHSPLVTVTAYRPKDRLCIAPGEDYFRLTYYYPNPLPLNISLERDRVFSQPTRITYCPACDKAIQVALGNERSNQAMQPTASPRTASVFDD